MKMVKVKQWVTKDGQTTMEVVEVEETKPPVYRELEQWELDSMEETKEREREDGRPEYGPYSMRKRWEHYCESRN